MKPSAASLVVAGVILAFRVVASAEATTKPAVVFGPPLVASTKPAPPDATAQKNAMNVVDDVYKADLAKASSPADKIILAKKLIQVAAETTNDSGGRFALCVKAREVAAQAGDIDTAFVAIEQLCSYFQADALSMKAEALAIAAKTARQAVDQKVLLGPCDRVIDDALAENQFDVARQVCDLALGLARRVGDTALVKKATGRIGEVREAEVDYGKLKSALLILEQKPSDPEANLLVGRHRCFVKGDWERGLPMLALGSDSALRSMAAKELKGAADADARVALGDGWWDLAEKESGLVKNRLQERASKWYDLALADLAGLTKARIEKRLQGLPPRRIDLLHLTQVEQFDQNPRYFRPENKA